MFGKSAQIFTDTIQSIKNRFSFTSNRVFARLQTAFNANEVHKKKRAAMLIQSNVKRKTRQFYVGLKVGVYRIDKGPSDMRTLTKSYNIGPETRGPVESITGAMERVLSVQKLIDQNDLSYFEREGKQLVILDSLYIPSNIPPPARPYIHSNLRHATPIFHPNLRHSAKMKSFSNYSNSECVPEALLFWLLNNNRPKNSLNIEDLWGKVKENSTHYKKTLETNLHNVTKILNHLKELLSETVESDASSGYSIQVISMFCEFCACANMYIFDRNDHLIASVVKFTEENKKRKTNLSPFIAYATDDHLSFIACKDIVNSVIQSNRFYLSNKRRHTPEEFEKVPSFKESTFFYHSEFDLQMEGGIHFMDKEDLVDEVKTLLQNHIFPEAIRGHNRGEFVKVTFQKDQESPKVTLYINQWGNEVEKVVDLCVSNGVNPVGGGLGALGKKLMKTLDRPKYNKEQKVEILNKQKWLCNCGCGVKFEKVTEAEVDHITRRIDGGNDEMQNLQALTKLCHKEKTQSELNRGKEYLMPFESVMNLETRKMLEIGWFTFNEFREGFFPDKANVRVKETADFPLAKMRGKVGQIHKKQFWNGKYAVYFGCEGTYDDIDEKDLELVVADYKHSQAWDLNSCRLNMIKQQDLEWFTMDVNTKKTKGIDAAHFNNGELCCGLFLINAPEFYPFQGKRFYNQRYTQLYLRMFHKGKEDILASIISPAPLKADALQPYFDILVSQIKDTSFKKAVPLAYIGTLGSGVKDKSNRTTKTEFFTEPNDIANHYIKAQEDGFQCGKRKFMPLDDGRMIYVVDTYMVKKSSATGYFIFKQIKEDEGFYVFQMKLQIESYDAIPKSIVVDSIRFVHNGTNPIFDSSNAIVRDNKPNVPDFTWKDGTFKAKYEEYKDVISPYFNRGVNIIEDLELENKWNILEKDDPNWRQNPNFFRDMMQRAHDKHVSCTIEGLPGTGKSTCEKILRELCVRYDLNEVGDLVAVQSWNVFAFMHVAVFNVTHDRTRGFTLDRLGHMINSAKRGGKSFAKFKSNFNKLTHVFVEEISMLTNWMWRILIQLKLWFPHLLFFCFGDFNQHEPVKDGSDYEDCQALFDLCDGNKITLEYNRRIDDDESGRRHFEYTKRLASNLPIPLNKPIILTGLNITYTQRKRMEIVQKVQNCLKHMTQIIVKKPERKCNKACCKSEDQHLWCTTCSNWSKQTDLHLFVGYPLIVFKTDEKKGIFNSDFWIVREILEESVIVQRLLRQEEVERNVPMAEMPTAKLLFAEIFQNFRCSFAMTSYACQGLSLKILLNLLKQETGLDIYDKFTIYEWNPKWMKNIGKRAKKHRTVSWSRGSNCDMIQIEANKDELIEEIEEEEEIQEEYIEEEEEEDDEAEKEKEKEMLLKKAREVRKRAREEKQVREISEPFVPQISGFTFKKPR